MVSQGTFFISGNDLYCRDAGWARNIDVYLEYLPQPNTVFYTAFNRNPEIVREEDRSDKDRFADWGTPAANAYWTQKKFRIYGMYELELVRIGSGGSEPPWNGFVIGTGTGGDRNSMIVPMPPPDETYPYYQGNRFIMRHMGDRNIWFDITEGLYRGSVDEVKWNNELYDLVYLSFDYPYAFATYRHRSTGIYHSQILTDLMGAIKRTKYNPFDYTGRHSNVRFIDASYNDDTGMGVVIEDHDDYNVEGKPVLKRLGFTPDTLMIYPQPCIYDYLVAHLARRFANKNETDIKDIEYTLALAEREMSMFLKKERNPWQRVKNVTGPRISDVL
jgi:hypothetical protein